jgi:hypothetical protein
MEDRALNVLLIGENEQSWWHLTHCLGHLGCRSWFASTIEQVRFLISQHPFRLILSTRPVTGRSPLMQMVRPECSVFYSIPVEDSCLWFKATAEALPSPCFSALRPREFMSVLCDLISEICAIEDGQREGQNIDRMTDHRPVTVVLPLGEPTTVRRMTQRRAGFRVKIGQGRTIPRRTA